TRGFTSTPTSTAAGSAGALKAVRRAPCCVVAGTGTRCPRAPRSSWTRSALATGTPALRRRKSASRTAVSCRSATRRPKPWLLQRVAPAIKPQRLSALGPKREGPAVLAIAGLLHFWPRELNRRIRVEGRGANGGVLIS